MFRTKPLLPSGAAAHAQLDGATTSKQPVAPRGLTHTLAGVHKRQQVATKLGSSALTQSAGGVAVGDGVAVRVALGVAVSASAAEYGIQQKSVTRTTQQPAPLKPRSRLPRRFEVMIKLPFQLCATRLEPESFVTLPPSWQ